MIVTSTIIKFLFFESPERLREHFVMLARLRLPTALIPLEMDQMGIPECLISDTLGEMLSGKKAIPERVFHILLEVASSLEEMITTGNYESTYVEESLPRWMWSMEKDIEKHAERALTISRKAISSSTTIGSRLDQWAFQNMHQSRTTRLLLVSGKLCPGLPPMMFTDAILLFQDLWAMENSISSSQHTYES